jgi:chromosome segregation ATPase
MSPSRVRRDKPRGIFEPKLNPWLARSLERVWYILLPLIGVWIAEAKFIEPNVTSIRNEGIIARLKAEQKGRQLLNEMNATESRIRAATFERDSVLAPAINRRVFMVDSLRAIQYEEQANVDVVVAQIDSLNTVTKTLELETVALGDSLVALKARKTEADAAVLTAADSLGRVRARIDETWTKVNALKEEQKARPKPAKSGN